MLNMHVTLFNNEFRENPPNNILISQYYLITFIQCNIYFYSFYNM